jgi:proline racemase
MGNPEPRFEGVYVAMATPFGPDGAVDLEGLARNCQRLIAAGVHGIVPCGSLGEYEALADDERAGVVKTTIDAAAGGAEVVPGVSGKSAAEARRWVEAAADLGCRAVMCLPPTAHAPTPDEVIAHFAEVARPGLDVIAYNNPFSTRVDLTPALLARLAEIDAVVAVKEFSQDIRRVAAIRQAAPRLRVRKCPPGAVGQALRALPDRKVGRGGRCLPADAAPSAMGRRPPVRPSHQARDGRDRLRRRRCASASSPARARRCIAAAQGAPAIPRGRLMRSRLVVSAIDSHTEGMPTRVVTGGLGDLPGETMADRRQYVMEERDSIRRFLMHEPRGHSAMSGAILQRPTRPDADVGVVFIEVSGCLPMCGHGTIGTATVLVESGMVEVKEPVTVIRLDTPAGLVTATVDVHDGHATSVTVRNVPAYLHLRAATVEVPGTGTLTLDLAWGGNFYAIVPAASVGLRVEPGSHDRLIRAGLDIMESVNDQLEFSHPEHTTVDYCRHVMLTEPGDSEVSGRAATAIHPGWLDRSPCGTGTSARMAQLFARGELGLGEDYVHASVIGSRFVGRLLDTTRVAGFDAVVPSFRGRAWITGMASYLLDPDDPYPEGFLLGRQD